MPINVLVASADLDVHELVADILEIIFKDITLDRVLDVERAREKLSGGDFGYNLILLDYHLSDIDGKLGVTAFSQMHESVAERLVVIVDGANAVSNDASLKDIPTVSKPFSLDEFDQVVRTACQ